MSQLYAIYRKTNLGSSSNTPARRKAPRAQAAPQPRPSRPRFGVTPQTKTAKPKAQPISVIELTAIRHYEAKRREQQQKPAQRPRFGACPVVTSQPVKRPTPAHHAEGRSAPQQPSLPEMELPLPKIKPGSGGFDLESWDDSIDSSGQDLFVLASLERAV